ncbi:MAG: T9SS C-terminal target domain-containing protein [Calditrichaeota bacterium]|nr:MAG: T9SS C-terminal target domain-containing protein [Calditrichota bacterium]
MSLNWFRNWDSNKQLFSNRVTVTIFWLILVPNREAAGYNFQNGAVDFESSNLPIVTLDTGGEIIPVDSRIPANMRIIWNGDDERNFVTDPPNDFEGRIEIGLHGQGSLGFAKNSFRIETQDSLGENRNVSLLGMPKENDWILYAPYSDKTLMRNMLSYTLASEINPYAPRVKFCEVILNGEYQGVFVLTEKIKRDNNRVDITKILPDDLSEPEITGGYIFKKDKTNSWDNIIQLDRGLDLIIIEPDKDEILAGQTDWLKRHLNEFDRALFTTGEFENYIDVQSFIDNFLIVEFTKNIDGLRLSTYFHKDRNDKIVAGPVWDYNLSLGNADYSEGWTPIGWYHTHIEWDKNWWNELIKIPAFYDLIGERWRELRQNQFNSTRILGMIEEWKTVLQEAQVRNFTKYPVLGTYLWPNPGYPQSGSFGFDAPKSGAPASWEEEILVLKDFVKRRIQWIDAQYNLSFVDLSIELAQTGQGHILYNNSILSNNAFLGSFARDEPVTLRAEPRPGYEFVRWEETIFGEIKSTWVEKGSNWKYLDNGSNLGDAWVAITYNDTGWREGNAEFGYGDNDETTVVSYGSDSRNKFITTYFRKSFNVTNPGAYDALTIRLLRDDGAVIYLNGNEIIRSNMPGTTINFNTLAEEYVDGVAEKIFHTFTVNQRELRTRRNILAVEIHQQNIYSSDLSFDLEFTGTGNSQQNTSTIIGNDEYLIYRPTASATIKAVFRPLPGYSADLVINEIHYNPTGGENYEFIELYNNSDSSLNLSNYSFAAGIEFTFPAGYGVEPGEFIILAKDKTTFNNLNSPVFQWIGGNLSNEGEHLILVNSIGQVVDSVNYGNAAPWPESQNNGGFSIELKNPHSDNALAENWQASFAPGGSPGQPSVKMIQNLFINEFLASNTRTNQDEFMEFDDWIELYNAGDDPIDIGGLYFSDDENNRKLWQIPQLSPYTTTIEPDNFLLLWADDDPDQGILHLGFQLNKSGESISVSQVVNSEIIVIDSIKYTQQAADVSMGRFPEGGDFWNTSPHPTPGTKNTVTHVDGSQSTLVHSYKLQQNYPNPFNPQTTINYALAKPGKVRLTVFDVLGRKIQTLVNANQAAGSYLVSFDASRLPSGIYIYRLEAESFVKSQKMILLR